MNPIRQTALAYARKNKERFVRELSELVAIPSCSFPGFPPAELERSAEAVRRLLERSGLEHARVLRLKGAHPYVYADWLHAPGKPTLLLYAHHDVQPPGRESLWRTPPYKATRKGARLYGRGAADDKAGVCVHAAAIASYLRTAGRLPVNVKLVIEGEEETGSEHLEAFLEKYAKELEADVMVLTDTSNFDVGVPSVTTALRGLVNLDVTVRTADHPLHSGMWGGPLPDPILALAKMIASLTDKSGCIAVPGVYEDVISPSRAERRSLRSLRYPESLYRSQTQVLGGVRLVGGPASPLEKMWNLPSVSVNAIESGSRQNAANVIRESAWCRVGLRLVPGMEPKKTLRRLMEHLRRHAPWGVRVEFSEVTAAPAWRADPDGPAFAAARRALKAGFGREAVYIGCGGSIPFVGPFSKALKGAPALLIGVEDPYANAHSENENLHLGDFQKAVLASVHLYAELAEAVKARN